MKKIGLLVSICMFALVVGGCAKAHNDTPEPAGQDTEQNIAGYGQQAGLERLRNLHPIDDEFMRCLFKDNIPLAETGT